MGQKVKWILLYVMVAIVLTPVWFGSAVYWGLRAFGREFLEVWRDRTTHREALEYCRERVAATRVTADSRATGTIRADDSRAHKPLVPELNDTTFTPAKPKESRD